MCEPSAAVKQRRRLRLERNGRTRQNRNRLRAEGDNLSDRFTSTGEGSTIEVLLTCIRMAARDTNLYTFQRPDRGVLPEAEPGAHIGVILPNGIERQYSLITAGRQLTEYT